MIEFTIDVNDLAVKEDDSRTVKLIKGILERFRSKWQKKLVASLHS